MTKGEIFQNIVRDQRLTNNRFLNLTMPLNYDKWNALEVHTDQLRKCMDSEVVCVTSSLMIPTLRVTQMSITRLWYGKWRIIGMNIHVGKYNTGYWTNNRHWSEIETTAKPAPDKQPASHIRGANLS